MTAPGSSCNSGAATQGIAAGGLVGLRVDFVSLPSSTSAQYGFVCN